jgi:hypothetical protein
MVGQPHRVLEMTKDNQPLHGVANCPMTIGSKRFPENCGMCPDVPSTGLFDVIDKSEPAIAVGIHLAH